MAKSKPVEETEAPEIPAVEPVATHESVLVTGPIDASMPSTPEEKPKKEALITRECGHVNKQFYGVNGKLEDLACTREAGHKGDHFAPCLHNVPDHIYDQGGNVAKQHWVQEETVAAWGNAAGKPTTEIKEGKVNQLSQFQKDLVAQVLKENSGMGGEEALSVAKQSPAWLAGNA
jgi:hypothetical protein